MRRGVASIVNRRSGIVLDLGNAVRDKDKSMVRMGSRGENDVDIVHDILKAPYPLPDESCTSIVARHVVEHVDRAGRGLITMMNEWWRVLKPHGRLMSVSLYGLEFSRDPAACSPVTQDLWTYFMPDHASKMWERYRPRPWKMVACSFNNAGTIEVILEKLPLGRRSEGQS